MAALPDAPRPAETARRVVSAVAVCGVLAFVLAPSGLRWPPAAVEPDAGPVRDLLKPVGSAPTPRSRAADPATGGAPAVDPSREGRAAYLRGDLSAAVERFTGAVAAEPRNADALNGLGQSLVRAGRAADALPYFDRAIAIEDDVWAYRFNRARAYGELGEWARAVAEYRAALRLFPDDYVTEFNLARALQADGRINEAVASFERAARLAPGQADFQAALGRALEAARRPREAAAAYRRYLELNPAEPSVDKIRARIGELENRSP